MGIRLVHPLAVAPQGGMGITPNVTIRLEDSPMAAKKSKKAAKKPAAKKSPARKAPVKKAAAKKSPAKAKKPAAKRKPNAAFMKPMQPDASLAAVVGSSPMPRTEVTSKL